MKHFPICIQEPLSKSNAKTATGSRTESTGNTGGPNSRPYPATFGVNTAARSTAKHLRSGRGGVSGGSKITAVVKKRGYTMVYPKIQLIVIFRMRNWYLETHPLGW